MRQIGPAFVKALNTGAMKDEANTLLERMQTGSTIAKNLRKPNG